MELRENVTHISGLRFPARETSTDEPNERAIYLGLPAAPILELGASFCVFNLDFKRKVRPCNGKMNFCFEMNE